VDRVLENFIISLRRWGVRVSPAESMDAARVVELLGYLDRDALKTALAAALAKSASEQEILERCFERFFSLGGTVAAPIDARDASAANVEMEASALTQMLLSGDEAGLALAIQLAIEAVDATSLRFLTQKGQYTQRVLGQLQLDALNRDIESFRRSRSMGGTAAALQRARDELYAGVRSQVERQFALFAPFAAESLDDEDFIDARLSGIDERNYRRIHRIVRRMVRELNALYSRRRTCARVGLLDFKKTFRANMASQGVLFKTVWKKKRQERPEVVAICDISRSVRHISRFFLLFLYSLNELVSRIRTFLFCSNLVEASHIFESFPLEEAVGRLETGRGLPIYFGLTDYGQALMEFKENHLHKVSRRTTVFIIGDARNNYDQPRAEILRLIRRRCRKIVWLNPENPALWGSGDSVMTSYLPYCDVARECNTLNHLKKVAELLTRPQP
jgi:uncharacterized protein with von Willebrand factor type A (vWA) domain